MTLQFCLCITTLAWMPQVSVGIHVEHQTKSLKIPKLTIVAAPGNADWLLVGANLNENFVVTWADLTVKNTGNSPVELSHFYAEYFDAKGARCFSAAFLNIDPIAPDETRTMSSSMQGLAPATAPVEVRVYPMEPGKRTFDELMVVPPTVNYLKDSGLDHLPAEVIPKNRRRSVQTLALAEVDVDANGQALGVSILDATSPDAEKWFARFVLRISFSPQMRGTQPERATTLVLCRFVAGYQDDENVPPYVAREDDFVKHALANFTPGAAPVVNELRFEPAAYWGESESRAAPTWLFVSLGTYWSANAIKTGDRLPTKVWSTAADMPTLKVQ